MIRINWNGTAGDIAIENGDIARDDSLYSEVVMRLFTDRLAESSDEFPDAGTDRRGVWSDSYEEELQGSRLWLLSRRKVTQDTINAVREYAEEALASLITDGLALSVSVSAERSGLSMIVAFISITLPDGSEYSPFPSGLTLGGSYAI